jgi:hypothetical protein
MAKTPSLKASTRLLSASLRGGDHAAAAAYSDSELSFMLWKIVLSIASGELA